MVKADTLWFPVPLDYLSWLGDKRTNYSMHEIQLYLQYKSGDLNAGNIVCSDLKNEKETIFPFMNGKKKPKKQTVNSHLLLTFSVNLFLEESFFSLFLSCTQGCTFFLFFSITFYYCCCFYSTLPCSTTKDTEVNKH